MKIVKINDLKTGLIKTSGGFKFPNYKTTGESSFMAGLLAGVKNAGKTNTMCNILEIEKHLMEKDNKVLWFSGSRDDKVKLFEAKYPNNFIYIGALDLESFNNTIEMVKRNIEEWGKKFKLVSILEKYLLKHKLTPEELQELENASYCNDVDFENMNLEYPPIHSLVLDDSLGSDLISGYGKNAKIFQRFFIAHRHLYTNVFILSQHIKSISRPLRVNLNTIIVFPMRSTDIYSSIFPEFSNLFKNKLENFINIMNVIEEKNNHSFLTIYQDKNKFVRINFDEEVIF